MSRGRKMKGVFSYVGQKVQTTSENKQKRVFFAKPKHEIMWSFRRLGKLDMSPICSAIPTKDTLKHAATRSQPPSAASSNRRRQRRHDGSRATGGARGRHNTNTWLDTHGAPSFFRAVHVTGRSGQACRFCSLDDLPRNKNVTG